MSKSNVDTILVSKTNDILVVGRKRMNQSVEIINAFQGEEAEELYKKLVGEKKDADISE